MKPFFAAPSIVFATLISTAVSFSPSLSKVSFCGGHRNYGIAAATKTSSSSSSRFAQTSSSISSTAGPFEYALIFDCDGVIIETEELHRLAYNAAFQAAKLEIDGNPVEWSVEYYDVLQNTVGGGKGKMFYHFRNTTGAFPTFVQDGKVMSAPQTLDEQQSLIDNLQAHKTELYKELIAEKATPRPGVIELMDEAMADPKIAVGVCSASTKQAVTKVLDVTLGQERRNRLNVCILGDDVSKLKPDPLIYVTAAERLNIDPSKCVVVEDSMVGLRAAKGAVSDALRNVCVCVCV